MSESTEHRKIKDLMSGWLKEWFGSSIQEYMSSGHELDVYAVTLNGVRICVEIIWSPSQANFYRDLNLVQGAEADVKLVVASPAVINRDDYQRELSKVATLQLRKNIAMHSEFVDGQKILDEPKYKDTVKDVVFKIVESRSRVTIHWEEFSPPAIPDIVNMSEILLSNLFPVKSIPQLVFNSPTDARIDKEVFAWIRRIHGEDAVIPAFVLKRGRLYTFDDLKNGKSVFSKIISADGVMDEKIDEWVRDGDKRRDLVRFLNLSLRSYLLERPDARYVKRHRRFMLLLKDGDDNLFAWRTKRGGIRQRTLAKRVHSDDGRLLYCWHNSADLRFMFLDGRLFLKIEPTFMFTWDGYKPVPRDKIPSLMARRAPMQYNDAYRDTVRLWAKWISRRDIEINIPAGGQRIVVGTIPIAVRMNVGIPGDR